MSSRSSPKTDPTAAPEARVTRGCKVEGYTPHLVTLRDRLAALSMSGLAWATLGSITRMMQARSGVQNLPNFLIIRHDARISAAPYVAPFRPFQGEVGLRVILHGPAYAVKKPALPVVGRWDVFANGVGTMTTVSSDRIRIKLKAYDYRILDKAVAEIVDTARNTGAGVAGPIPLPTNIHKYTIQRSVHVDKKSREQFEMRIHKRLMDILEPTQQTVDALGKLSLPAGVDVEIKL